MKPIFLSTITRPSLQEGSSPFELRCNLKLALHVYIAPFKVPLLSSCLYGSQPFRELQSKIKLWQYLDFAGVIDVASFSCKCIANQNWS